MSQLKISLQSLSYLRGIVGSRSVLPSMLLSNTDLTRRTIWLALLAFLIGLGVAGKVNGQTNHCHDCDGTYTRGISSGPLEGLRQWRKSFTCGGGGCGEVYVGEWISTPPDCYDPCCGDQFVGGAFPARPFAGRPRLMLGSGQLLNRISGRLCSGNESSAPCGCDSCGTGDYFDADHHFEGGRVSTILPSRFPVGRRFTGGGAMGGSGCSSCGDHAANH